MNHARTCDTPGPWVRLSAAYERQVHCNRVGGHPGKHREYDPRTFAIVAEWEMPPEGEPDPRKRRKVKA